MPGHYGKKNGKMPPALKAKFMAKKKKKVAKKPAMKKKR